MNPPDSGETLSGIGQNPLSCWWKIPGKEITVFLNMETIERINEEIKGAARDRIRNKEIGGLLLGTIDFDPALRITVTECIPVLCNHEFGPVHHLSDADKKLLRKQIDRCKAALGKSQYVLSYYRSNNRPYFQLTGEDLALARDFIPDLFFFLLIQPSSPTNVGGLFFSVETRTQPENRLLFPFDKDRLLSGQTILTDLQEDKRETSPIVIPKTPPAERLPVEMPAMPNPTQRYRSQLPINPMPAPKPPLWLAIKRSRSPWLWISLAGLLVLALAGIVYVRLRTGWVTNTYPKTESTADSGFEAGVEKNLLHPKTESAADLGLEAKVAGNLLYVKWNKTFPALLSAKAGILSIWDGASTNAKRLNVAELLRGDVTFPCTADHVTVQLLLISEEVSASGSTSTEASASSTASATASAETADYLSNELARGKQTPQPDTVVSNSPKSASIPRSPPAATDLPPQPLPKAAEKANIEVKSSAPTSPMNGSRPAIPPTSSAVRGTGNAPQAADAAAPNKKDQPAQSQGDVSAIQPPPAPAVPAAESLESAPKTSAMDGEPRPVPPVERTADSAIPPSLPDSSTQNSGPGSAFVPPQPIDAVKPIALPSDLGSRLPKSQAVSIRVYIDATGAVIGAKSLSKDAQLSSLAVDAVRRMRFTPARRGNQNVASELILNLEFVRNESKSN
jgi:periplasmic protein TonB